LDKRYIAAEKTYRAIGRFIFEFSQVEHTIRHYVGESIGLNGKYFSDIVESYDIAMLCNIAESVFEKSLHKNMVAKLKPLISNFRALNDNRVRVAHGLWMPFLDGGTVHHTSRRLKREVKPNQAAFLEKLADEACYIRAEMERAFGTTPEYD
jgi:hypothetical protein